MGASDAAPLEPWSPEIFVLSTPLSSTSPFAVDLWISASAIFLIFVYFLYQKCSTKLSPAQQKNLNFPLLGGFLEVIFLDT